MTEYSSELLRYLETQKNSGLIGIFCPLYRRCTGYNTNEINFVLSVDSKTHEEILECDGYIFPPTGQLSISCNTCRFFRE